MSLLLTLLAGPSTSLRDDLVRCLVLRRPGLVAVVYDVEPGGLVRRVVDAAGEQQREALAACCLSCAVRDDAPEALALLAAAGRWTEVVLALPASARPGDLAAVLDAAGTPVDTISTVVDARLLLAQVSGSDLLAERGQAAAPTDRRSTAELVVGQLEDADVLAVADLHRLQTAQARAVQALLAHLAPLALQVPLGPGGAGCDGVVGTGRHDAVTSAADRERLAALATELCPPDCGVATVRWTSERPLHSGRLAAALPDIVEGTVRSRGYVWLADRPRERLRWESAGGTVALGDPAPWDALPGCELVLTGLGLDPAAVRAGLDACRCDNAELAAGVSWPDPFADALGPAESAR